MLRSQLDSIEGKIGDYLVKSNEFLQTDLDSAIYFSEEAVELLQSFKNDTVLGNYFSDNTYFANDTAKEKDSIHRCNLEKLPSRTKGLIWYHIGVFQHKKMHTEKALGAFLKAVKILEKHGESDEVADVYTYIGITSLKLKYFDSGIKYYKKALLLLDKEDVSRLAIMVELAGLYKFKEDHDKFLRIAQEAEVLSKKLDSKESLLEIYGHFTNYFEQRSDYDISIRYGKKTIALRKELNPNDKFGFEYYLVGSNYIEKKEYRTAIKYLDSALPISGSDDLLRSEIYEELRKSYAELSDYETALYYADLKNDIKDSIVNRRQQEKATELIEKFESEKKELRIVALIKEKEIQEQIASQAKFLQYLYLMASLFLLLLLAVGIWFFNKLRKQEKELTLVNQVKNRLFSIIAHDLRGMIIPFQRMGKIMKHHIDKENYGRTIEFSQELEKNSERLSNTLDNLLNWSLEQMDGYKICLEEILLGEELREIADNFEQHAIYKNININFKYDEDISFQFDKGAFHVIFRNLLGNALKFAENGDVIIQFTKQIDTLKCSVIDSGIGMSKEQVDTIFDIEKRHTEIGTKGEKGTGLGLNLVYRFVKMHRGTIQVSSKKSVGTRFDLSFPIEYL